MFELEIVSFVGILFAVVVATMYWATKGEYDNCSNIFHMTIAAVSGMVLTVAVAFMIAISQGNVTHPDLIMGVSICFIIIASGLFKASIIICNRRIEVKLIKERLCEVHDGKVLSTKQVKKRLFEE